MFKFPWRNGFAVGITANVCLATIVILFGQSIYDLARCNQNADCYRHAAKYEGKDFPSSWWWRWTGELVTSDDTLAQWIMAFFTIAVVLLVWRTLVATQEMAFDTRRIGKAQVRAYLKVQKAELGIYQNDCIFVMVHLKNTGQSPASNVQAKATFRARERLPVEQNGRKFVDVSADGHHGFVGQITSGDVDSLEISTVGNKLESVRVAKATKANHKSLAADITVSWFDVFGDRLSFLFHVDASTALSMTESASRAGHLNPMHIFHQMPIEVEERE